MEEQSVWQSLLAGKWKIGKRCFKKQEKNWFMYSKILYANPRGKVFNCCIMLVSGVFTSQTYLQKNGEII